MSRRGMATRSVLIIVAGSLTASMTSAWCGATAETNSVVPKASGQLEQSRAVETAHVATNHVAVAAGPGYDATAATRPTPGAPVQKRPEVQSGWEFIRRGDYPGAIDALTKAQAISSEDPRVFLGLGLSQYRLARYDSAALNLKRALQLDPALEQAHTLLGDLAFIRDDLESAVDHYESAMTLNPNDVSIQDGLFTVRRARQFEAGFARIVTPHFVIKCDETHRTDLLGVAERLEALQQRIGRQLPYRSGEKIVVVLYSEHRFAELTDSPAWVGGLFDGKIHLTAPRVFAASPEGDAALAHEYTHALVHRLANGHAPTWLSEGLALYFEGRALSWSEAILAHEAAELTPLHALHGSFMSLSPHEATIAYAESLSATRLLIDRYGWVRIHRLLDGLARNDAFSAAFETAFKEPYHTFESSWATAQSRRSL